jgi:hypothetical protein
MIHVQTFMPRPRPADHIVHLLASAHLGAFGEFIRSEGNDATAGEDCEALVRALALTTARTSEGLADKGRVLRDRLSLYGTPQTLRDDCDDCDMRLLLSYVEDSFALAGW